MTLLPQQVMIETVRRLAQADERLSAVLMYGSFTQGEGDQFSDIEFYLFVEDEALPGFEREAWVAGVSPLLAYFGNEFGTEVAIFENLVRGEFHFQPASALAQVRGWGQAGVRGDPEAMILLDRTGELRGHVSAWAGASFNPADPAAVAQMIDRFLNWMLFGANVLRRGERARALDILAWVHRCLLWMARLAEGRLEHWPTPSRALEQDLSPEAYTRFAACTASIAPGALEAAYREAWRWGRDLMAALAARYGVPARDAQRPALLERMDARMQAWFGEGE